jgi:hypothetical protein
MEGMIMGPGIGLSAKGFPVNEMVFQEAVRQSAENMIKNMSHEETVRVGYVPLVINHIAMHYAFLATKEAARQKISKLNPATRAARKIYQRYMDSLRQDLDERHVLTIEKEGERILKTYEWNFTTLYFAVNNQIKKFHADLRYDELRTFAHMSIIAMGVMLWHNGEMDKLVRERIGVREKTLPNPHVAAMGELMKAYIGDALIKYDGAIKTGIEIFKKNISHVTLDLD